MNNNRIANKLSISWGIGANQVRYRRTGDWYHCLTEFPAALLDENGFIRFESENHYRKCSHLKIKDDTDQVHVKGSISEIPGYIKRKI